MRQLVEISYEALHARVDQFLRHSVAATSRVHQPGDVVERSAVPCAPWHRNRPRQSGHFSFMGLAGTKTPISIAFAAQKSNRSPGMEWTTNVMANSFGPPSRTMVGSKNTIPAGSVPTRWRDSSQPEPARKRFARNFVDSLHEGIFGE